MSVDLKFYDNDIMEINEMDIGESRINYGNISSFYVKNIGMDRARDCIITALPCNSLDELKEKYSNEEAERIYNKQLKSASWKTFSFKKDSDYTNELSIGNIDANSFLKGKDTIQESFTNKDTCILQDVWSYCLEQMGNNSLKIYKNSAKSQTAQRKAVNIGKKRDVSISFKMEYEYDSSAYAKSSCLVIFPVRLDNRGYGYILSFQFRASDGKCFFGVYKDGKGMTSNLSRTYGTRIFDTNGYISFDSSKEMGAKIYTNDNDETCFEFIINGENYTLYNTKDKTKKGLVVIDTDNNYPNAGDMYFDVGMYYGDLSIKMSNLKIETETEKAPIYVKSKIGDDAVNGEIYESAICLTYKE